MVVVSQSEYLKGLQLPAWMRALFQAIVAVSDFKTGAVTTHYARLIALLDCDQPQSGPRLPTYTIKQVRNALDQLVALGIVWRDSDDNRSNGELKIFIEPRQRVIASAFKQGREQGRGKTPRKADEQRKRAKVTHRTGQGTGQGYSDPSGHYSSGEVVDNLPTAAQAGEGEKLAPQGGQTVAPAGHAPQGARTIADVLEGHSHKAPPGGPTQAPTGHAPRWTEVRDGNMHERWPADLADPTTWARDERGRLIAPADHGIHHLPRWQRMSSS